MEKLKLGLVKCNCFDKIRVGSVVIFYLPNVIDNDVSM